MGQISIDPGKLIFLPSGDGDGPFETIPFLGVAAVVLHGHQEGEERTLLVFLFVCTNDLLKGGFIGDIAA